MEELVKTFHIDVKLIIAQAVNFAIVLFVLYRFAYKPILKTLNDRTAKVEKGLRDAEEAAKKMTDMEAREKEVIAEARKEAQKIIEESQKMAESNKALILEEAQKKSEEILVRAEERIEEEKSKMLTDVKGQISELVVAATEKVLGEKVDSEKDKKFISELVK